MRQKNSKLLRNSGRICLYAEPWDCEVKSRVDLCVVMGCLRHGQKETLTCVMEGREDKVESAS